jgi:6-phosphogluconolactonase (cycloisomerase 2 family)
MKQHLQLAVSAISVVLFTLAHTVSGAVEGSQGGALYVMSNKASGNSVFAYERASDGSLTFVQQAQTRGLGTGVALDPLMSQGAIALRADGKLLLAVNSASGDLTAFTVTDSGLEFGSKVASGGAFPVSVTVRGGLVYVLNQLGEANISGFTVTDSGQLQAIPSSTRTLAGGPLALPAQVSFTPDGSQLLVTEKGTHLLDIFRVLRDGSTEGPIAQRSSGKTPFGFAFGPNETVVVSEVENRRPLKSTVSSYRLTGDASLQSVSPKVPNGQSGACWVAITEDTAWIVNTGTATISAYQIGATGELTLLNPVAASTGDATTPIDLAASSDGNFLYVLKSATGEIAAFKIEGSNLTPLFTQGGLPLSTQGIVVQ